MTDRHAVRMHALDGELLFFQPSTGESARLRSAETARLCRRAPRVVLFGLSHACNLTCGFCSRDADNRARWSPERALGLLEQLSLAGTLEVAFELSETYGSTAVRLDTDAPHAAMAQLDRAASHIEAPLWLSLSLVDPLAHALTRLRTDIGQL